jgi:hypothetical protein
VEHTILEKYKLANLIKSIVDNAPPTPAEHYSVGTRRLGCDRNNYIVIQSKYFDFLIGILPMYFLLTHCDLLWRILPIIWEET